MKSKMASSAEDRMNLATLQQHDHYITEIVNTAKQVALYTFSAAENKWEKTDIEGTLFVYSRSASPFNGFIILNRLGMNNLIEPIDRNLEFQIQDPFLLYRNSQLHIYGIWFYDKDECATIGQLVTSLAHKASEKHAERTKQPVVVKTKTIQQVFNHSTSDNATNLSTNNNIDIMQLLSKAQHEFDAGSGKQNPEPKPMINNPHAGAITNGSNDLIKPQPVKAHTDTQETSALDTLFKNAALTAGHMSPRSTLNRSTSAVESAVTSTPSDVYLTNHNLSTTQPSTKYSSHMPPVLQRLMSVPGTTLEELEKQHHTDTTGYMQPEILSPASELKKSLNILPTPPKNAEPNPSALSSQQNYRVNQYMGSESSPLKLSTSAMGVSRHRNTETVGSTDGLLGSVEKEVLFSRMPDSAKTKILNTSYSPGQMVKAQVPARRRLSSLGSGTSSQLVTPAELMSSTSDIPIQQTSAPYLKKGADILITPDMFQSKNIRVASPSDRNIQGVSNADSLSLESSTVSSDDNVVASLTKEQMQESLIYLIKNDSSFLITLHEAYVKSINERAMGKK